MFNLLQCRNYENMSAWNNYHYHIIINYNELLIINE